MKKNVYITGLCMGLFNLATILPVILLADITDKMMQQQFQGDIAKLPVLGYAIWGIAILMVIYAAYRITYHKKYLSSGEEDMRLRMELANKIRRLPLSYIGRRNLTDIATVIMEDVMVVANSYVKVLGDLIGGFSSGIIALIALFFVEYRLALSLAVCLPLVGIIMSFSRVISERTNKSNRRKKMVISDGVQEYLENVRLLKAAGNMEAYQKGLEKKMKSVIPGLVLYEFLAGLTISLSYNIMRIGLGIVILTGSSLLISGEISLVIFFLFLYVAVRIYEPITNGCELLGELIFSKVSSQRIDNLLHYQEQSGCKDTKLKNFDIEFQNVSFGYNEEDVLHNVSFTAKQGEITALVGPSGCGKSTISKLAARFWDVNKGKITIGGNDISEIEPEKLLENYSFVFQDVVLFNDTVYNNIAIGKQNATKEEVEEAARLAGCDFVERLPQGFDTIIGENGKTLSGGERQRLSIARAFLKDAPVILLDESTASLDPENETKIQKALSRLIENKTVLIIAHKLRTIMECDKIVVLEEGHVKEIGKHTELIEKKGLYNRLYTLQNESNEWVVGKGKRK